MPDLESRGLRRSSHRRASHRTAVQPRESGGQEGRWQVQVTARPAPGFHACAPSAPQYFGRGLVASLEKGRGAGGGTGLGGEGQRSEPAVLIPLGGMVLFCNGGGDGDIGFMSSSVCLFTALLCTGAG